jgi:hypothetical protein
MAKRATGDSGLQARGPVAVPAVLDAAVYGALHGGRGAGAYRASRPGRERHGELEMAIDYVVVSGNTGPSNALLSAFRQIQAGENSLVDIKAQMDHMTDALNWSAVELRFGLQVGQGADVYAMVSAILAGIQAASVKNALDRVTGP